MTTQEKKYLSDILQAISLIEDFIQPIDNYEQYLSDVKTQSAIERQLAIIGEAANKFDKLSEDRGLDNIRKIIGFRNRLIHAYDTIDPAIVWAIIQKHLTPLKEEVEKKLA